MSQRYAPIRDPQFEGRPTVDGVPVGTMQDLMELRNSWLDKLNDRVVELFFSNGNASVSAPNTNPISNSSLSRRVAIFMNRIHPHPVPAGCGLLIGLPAGSDFHYPGDPTVIPDAQIRTSGIFPSTTAYRFSPFKNKDGKWSFGEVRVTYSMLDKKTIKHVWEVDYYTAALNGGYLFYEPESVFTDWFNWRTNTIPQERNTQTNALSPFVHGVESGTHETQPLYAPSLINNGDIPNGIDPACVTHKSRDYGLVFWCMAIREQS